MSVAQDIGRVLLNLINNAFQAISSERSTLGSVQESSKENRQALVRVTTHGKKDYVQITVSDNGPGIPDEVKDKIFQPFFTTKPSGQGTGLGLSLSYDIVQAHGGELSVESRLGEGSVFSIRIPQRG